jgi:hypothetical protein
LQCGDRRGGRPVHSKMARTLERCGEQGTVHLRILTIFPSQSHVLTSKWQVPTVLVYPKSSVTPSSWGFLSEASTEQLSEDKDYKEWFKTYLDEEKLRKAQGDPQTKAYCPASIQEVERL